MYVNEKRLTEEMQNFKNHFLSLAFSCARLHGIMQQEEK